MTVFIYLQNTDNFIENVIDKVFNSIIDRQFLYLKKNENFEGKFSFIFFFKSIPFKEVS